jgi:hydroxypyruvate reductase
MLAQYSVTAKVSAPRPFLHDIPFFRNLHSLTALKSLRMPHTGQDQERLLRMLFDCAVDAVSPCRVLPPLLPKEPKGRTLVLAAGKAATAMADVVARNWKGPVSGLAVTRYGHVLTHFNRHENIELIEAGHPVPDQNSVAGARRALELAQDLRKDDLALVLISGGGSALWCLPIPELALHEKQRITSELLHAGAAITELNTVRKALSRIKGGRLAEAASPARVETLIISDVVGDDPAMIASGPTVRSGETLEDVQEILSRYRVELPQAVWKAIRERPTPAIDESRNRCRIVAAGRDALAAAEEAARSSGYDVLMLGDAIEGEARKAAAGHAAMARKAAQRGTPTVILSGGELTVAVRDRNGIGGPNTEFLLALAIELGGAEGVYAIACDTDGIDGIGENAGAVIRPDTLARARATGVDPRQALDGSDSFRFFEALGDLVVTGPTQTNVSDFRAIVVCGN